jgi:hypothetical protein
MKPLEPHPDQDDQPEAGRRSAAGIIAVVVIGLVLLIVVVLHLAGVMGPSAHG